MLPGGPPTKKRKGGVQQRLAKAAQEQECQSALYALLMTHFAKGLMSGALIHSIAKAAQQDLENAASGLKITELKKIASLEHAKNLGPMLTRMMAKESTLPDPLQVHMPMICTPQGVINVTWQSPVNPEWVVKLSGLAFDIFDFAKNTKLLAARVKKALVALRDQRNLTLPQYLGQKGDAMDQIDLKLRIGLNMFRELKQSATVRSRVF